MPGCSTRAPAASGSGVRWRGAVPRPPPGDPPAFLLELLRSNFIYVATTVRRAVLENVGGFDEDLDSSEDYDLWLRIVAAGHEAVWVAGRQAMYRKHPDQMSKNLRTMSESLLAVYERVAPEALPSDRHRELLARRRILARRQRQLWSRVSGATAARAVASLKRAGIGEAWLADPPSEVQDTLALTTAGR